MGTEKAPIEFSPEIAALRLFTSSKSDFIKYSDIIDQLTLDTEIRLLLDSIKEYYNQFKDHDYIGKDEFIGFITSTQNMSKNLTVILSLVTKMYDMQVSTSYCKTTVDKLVEKNYANKILQKLLPVISENAFDVLATVEGDIDEYKSYLSKNKSIEESYVQTSLATILEKHNPLTTTGLNWRLQSLRDALGPLVGDSLIHIVARPEVGKTAFLCSELTYIAEQLSIDECVLWVNNEEASDRIRLRLHMSLLNATQDQLIAKVDEASRRYEKQIGSRIRIVDDKTCVMSVENVTRLVKEIRPRVLVIDHGDKLTYQGSKHADIPVRLRQLYNHYRSIGKIYDIPVLVVGHANTDGEGKKWLTFDHLDYSRTGKAAEIDVMLGIGMTHTEAEQGVRYINLPKNKLSGIHAKITLGFDPTRARYFDLGER